MCNFGGINLIEYLPGGKIVNSAAVYAVVYYGRELLVLPFYCWLVLYVFTGTQYIFGPSGLSMSVLFDAEAKSSLSAVMPQEDPFSII